jgi:glucosyl-dolichyl phosphate glucuronosyltransferase
MSALETPSAVPGLSVVICAYTAERWDDIRAAVASLRAQTVPVQEVLLVIDHNADLLTAARQEFRDVVCLPNTGPRGLSGARNCGVAAATGDVVAFLDDDAAAEPDWAAGLLAPYSDGSVVGVGGKVLPAWAAPRPRWFPGEFLWIVGCSYTGLPTEQAEIRNPIGANMSFRRSVFEAVGSFDPTMGRLGKDAAGCEETEFSIRARSTGRILYDPAAVVRHTVTPDRVTRRYFRRRCRAEGRSKALVSRLSGTDAALETERRYVRETLPRGIGRGLLEALRGDAGGAARSWAILEATALTAGSYLLARATLRLRGNRPTGQDGAGAPDAQVSLGTDPKVPDQQPAA